MSIKLISTLGGSVTLNEPSTASDYTLTFPAQTGTVGLDGPAFSAYLSATQTITALTFTKIQFNTEEFDTNNNYDPTTNYRFTPTVAGYYQISGGAQIGGATNTNTIIITIYKNGVRFKDGTQLKDSAGVGNMTSTVSSVIYFNGTTDYVELYGYGGGSGTITVVGAVAYSSYFAGVFVRAA